jgi:Leucine-rich repeat (LRR) protein
MSDHVALQKIKAPSSMHARLQILPPSICKLRALNLLFLRFNQLETLPFAIGNCTSLTALDIRDNPIVYLPFSVAKLPMKGSDFYLDVPREELMFPPGKVTVRACIMISC